MSAQMTLWGTRKPTSSPESVDGPTRYGSLDGLTTNPFGLDRVPVSPSPTLAKGAALRTSGTSGPHSGVSLQSLALQRSSESRLRAMLEGNGSPLYELTVSRWGMPSGPSIFALRASVRRIYGNGCTGSLIEETSEKLAARTGWATPCARDWHGANAKTYRERGGGSKGEQLSNQVVHFGPWRSISNAPTEGQGRLSPDFARWLMGYPVEWDTHAPIGRPGRHQIGGSVRSKDMGTPSSRKSGPSSSGQ